MGEEELAVRESYIDEDGIEQEVIEEYNPNVDEEIENVELDVSMNETFKIDENMPDELKEQLENFNRHSVNLNSIISNSNISAVDDSYEDSYENSDDIDEVSENDDISEDDEEVGNLF